jgi:hypothetical protein
MSTDLTIPSPLSVDEALDRLRARGQEWRESTLPLPLRVDRVLYIDATVEENRFRILMKIRVRNDMKLGWKGVVVPADDGQTGCNLVIRPLNPDLPMTIAIVPFAAAFMRFGGTSWSVVVNLSLGLSVALGIFYFFVRPKMTADVADDVIAILRTTVDAPTPSQPKRFNIDPLQ